MALTFDQWKLGYGLTLIEEIAKECSTQVLVKVMLECQLMKASLTEENTTWFAWTYGAFNRWANGEDCLDEIETIMDSNNTTSELLPVALPMQVPVHQSDPLALYMLCSKDMSYDDRVIVDGDLHLTKKSVVAVWLSFHGITGDMIRSVMPIPPKNPDQEYCIIDETLVGCCNLFEQSEEIQYKWDVKKSFYGA